MLKEFKIIKTIIPFITPYIILYAIYIQRNGEVSPGGEFQAGVIFATGLISYDLIFGKYMLQKHFSIILLEPLAVSWYSLVYVLLGWFYILKLINIDINTNISKKNIDDLVTIVITKLLK